MTDKTKCERYDCFACKGGRCIALMETFTQKCPFYKTVFEHLKGVRMSFYRLVALNRLDLILRYWGTPADFSAYINDVKLPERIQLDVGRYRDKIRKMAGDGLSNCPACHREKCFAFVDGRCIALNSETEKCVFYRDVQDWYSGIIKSFCLVSARERFYLLSLYQDTLADIGAFEAQIEEAREAQGELLAYRQETYRTMLAADNLEKCYQSLKEKDCAFGMVEGRPEKDEEQPESEQTENGGNATESQIESDSVEEYSISGDEEITTIPEDEAQADDQMKEIGELVDDRTEDTLDAERTITLISQSGGSDPDTQENLNRLHEENRFVEDNVQTVFRIEDFYRPRLLHSQISKRRSDDDRVYGMMAAELFLLTAKDYVTALRRVWLEPENIERQIDVIRLGSFFGSKTYWLFTNRKPELFKDRCRDIAMAAEKNAILEDNRKLITQTLQSRNN